MRDLCVHFPLQRRGPNMKLVYLWSWQSFSTPPMLLRMIITWVCAWATMQCGQVQPQMVVPVEDINTGNVKTTLGRVKAEGSGTLTKWDRKERSRHHVSEGEFKTDESGHDRHTQHEEDMRKCPLVLDGVINRWWWVESMLSSILNTRLWAGGVTFHPRQLETNRLDEPPEGTDSTQPLRSHWTPKPSYINEKEWPPRLLKAGQDTAETCLLSLCWHQLHDTTCVNCDLALSEQHNRLQLAT